MYRCITVEYITKDELILAPGSDGRVLTIQKL